MTPKRRVSTNPAFESGRGYFWKKLAEGEELETNILRFCLGSLEKEMQPLG
jgi:hypothetical protein